MVRPDIVIRKYGAVRTALSSGLCPRLPSIVSQQRHGKNDDPDDDCDGEVDEEENASDHHGETLPLVPPDLVVILDNDNTRPGVSLFIHFDNYLYL